MPHVSFSARALGFAGLLPALAATGLIALGRTEAAIVALLYPALILSFLGGMWWGFAMGRPEQHQGRLAVVAVLPSLVAIAILLVTAAGALATIASPASGWLVWPLIALGCAVILTLPVDRHLVRTGEAPAGWMGLRVPLSLGLGGLTILSAVLLHSA